MNLEGDQKIQNVPQGRTTGHVQGKYLSYPEEAVQRLLLQSRREFKYVREIKHRKG